MATTKREAGVADPKTQEELIHEISTLLDDVSGKFDLLNARIMSTKEKRGRLNLSGKMYGETTLSLSEMRNRPDWQPSDSDPERLAFLLGLYEQVPVFDSKIKTLMEKSKGLRISTGQEIANFMIYLYEALNFRVKRNKDLQPWRDRVALLFKKSSSTPSNEAEKKAPAAPPETPESQPEA